MATLFEKKIGETVKIDDPGMTGAEYIVIHKGIPSAKYDSSCNRIWLMRKNALGPHVFHSKNNDYEGSSLYLQITIGIFYKCSVSSIVNSARIPHYISNAVQDGENNGHSCFSFELSAEEIGFTAADNSNIPGVGSVLDYFKNGGSRKCCYDDGTAAAWWTRTPVAGSSRDVFCISADGKLTTKLYSDSCGYRPVILAANNLSVDENNYLCGASTTALISTTLPANMGTLTDGFSCDYFVSSKSSDTLNVTLKIDNKVIKSFRGVNSKIENFTLGGVEWMKLLNGQHSFSIILNDGYDTVERSTVFVKNCSSMNLTLSPPLQTDDLISYFNIKIIGKIPQDCEIKYEACNNANDADPAWEDITPRIKSGLNYIFKNKSAQNGYAVNFRITAKRGASKAGGYVEKIICEYE